MSLKTTINKIKSIGVENTRIVPTDDSQKYILEIREDGTWKKILKPMSKPMLEDVIRQSTNKVILG